jgi:hypothetical protein
MAENAVSTNTEGGAAMKRFWQASLVLVFILCFLLSLSCSCSLAPLSPKPTGTYTSEDGTLILNFDDMACFMQKEDGEHRYQIEWSMFWKGISFFYSSSSPQNAFFDGTFSMDGDKLYIDSDDGTVHYELTKISEEESQAAAESSMQNGRSG